jgi:hypothetical protein
VRSAAWRFRLQHRERLPGGRPKSSTANSASSNAVTSSGAGAPAGNSQATRVVDMNGSDG